MAEQESTLQCGCGNRLVMAKTVDQHDGKSKVVALVCTCGSRIEVDGGVEIPAIENPVGQVEGGSFH